MRVSSLIACTTLFAVGLVLVGTVALEHGLSFWLLDENELPVSRRAPPPNMWTKYMIWIQRFFYVSPDEVCHIYLAESTIPKSGMGVYTAFAIDPRGQIGSPELVIPITIGTDDASLWKVWANYAWAARIPNIDAEEAAFIPGIAASINSNYWEMTNLYAVGQAKYNTAQLHRTADVGAGAFTPWVRATLNAFDPVAAGGELFSFYGDQYIRRKPYKVDEDTFDRADQLLGSFDDFVREHPDLPDELKEAMWKELVQDFPVSYQQPGYGGVKVLPQKTWKELKEDESLERSVSVSRSAMRQGHERSVDWLKGNGFCMDWIEEGVSTLAQAGRGAFARRFIPKGTVVSLAPLIHIANKNVVDWCDDKLKRELVRNYSFGHKQSSLLLTPNGAGVGLINHSKRDRNIRLEWPKTQLTNHDPHFLEMPVSALSRQTEIQLSLEYVVTRNIYPGEELFLDYGPDWEDAWDRHIRKWRPQTEWYLHPSQVNRHEPIRTEAEIGYDPYPPNLFLECEVSFDTNEYGANVYVPPPETVDWEKCEVISRNSYTYHVRLESGVTIEQLPHNAISFETLPGMSDWALPNAFRHEIGLPDYLVPEIWKDKQPQSC